ncbi:baculoviral IAP repeat-containing protein 2-like [Mercenaria mercenaria]|uniref:baculoviral IAP repeat-containing protein 2-like n=1 Tax=Mercenaria mercenaria TaxID=6596 RepID=UPI00234FA951|nr:baculoviral IAP repeat-containing protein 2-like [Mercenaria mercenaria]
METLTIKPVNAEYFDQGHVMNNEWSRYLSFLNFPKDSFLMPTRLAQAGFYYTGSGEKVTCFCCGIQNEIWSENETVLDVHRRLSPHCRYICGEDTTNIPTHDHSSMLTVTVPTCSKGSYISKENKQEQIGSLVKHSTDVKEEQLLGNSGNSKMSNHVHQPYSEETMDIANNGTIKEKNENETSKNLLKTENRSKHKSEKQRLLEENRTLRDLITCKICFDNDACVVFLPCGHLASCVECSKSLRKCAVCRTVVQATVRVYQA